RSSFSGEVRVSQTQGTRIFPSLPAYTPSTPSALLIPYTLTA
ncbi:hypothetical protein AVEN_220968-1, partial [Araneus ventricosus]